MAEGKGEEGDVEVAHLVGQFRKQLSCPEASDALKSKQQCSLALPSSLGHCLERREARVECRERSRHVPRLAELNLILCRQTESTTPGTG